ncbi:hypothetical protein CapIbe_019956 [Capra ibex]
MLATLSLESCPWRVPPRHPRVGAPAHRTLPVGLVGTDSRQSGLPDDIRRGWAKSGPVVNTSREERNSDPK